MKLAIGTISYFTNDALFELFQQSMTTVCTTYDCMFMNVWNAPVTERQHQYLDSYFDWMKVSPENNVSLAWNMLIDGALAEGCTHILITNSDILYEHGAIDQLVQFMLSRPEVFVSGVKPYDDAAYHVPAYEGLAVHYCSFALNLGLWPQWLERDPDPVWKGHFDTKHFVPAYYEDIDFNRRIALARMKLEVCAKARCQHLVSQTIRLDPRNAAAILNNSYEVCRHNFVAKWGGDIGHETFTTPYNAV